MHPRSLADVGLRVLGVGLLVSGLTTLLRVLLSGAYGERWWQESVLVSGVASVVGGLLLGGAAAPLARAFLGRREAEGSRGPILLAPLVVVSLYLVYDGLSLWANRWLAPMDDEFWWQRVETSIRATARAVAPLVLGAAGLLFAYLCDRRAGRAPDRRVT